MKQFYLYLKRYFITYAAIALFILLSLIPLRLAMAYNQAPQPEAILTLGGSEKREKFTAEFARLHQNLDIWVSTGIPSDEASSIFEKANISENRLHLDYRATDTVTNFTTLVQDFRQRGIHHLFLITSDFHITRAKAIATIVLGSQGIIFTPISIPSEKPTESVFRILRDMGRSLFWIFTGHTGSSLNPHLNNRLYASR
ncbi:MAG: YdcF family protein [Cyanobacteria bacterium P01_A01_bin.45]